MAVILNTITILKFVELILAVICAALYGSGGIAANFGDHAQDMIISGTFLGFIIIVVGIITGWLFSISMDKRMHIIYGLLGCALFVASGALLINHYEKYSKGQYRDKGLALGSLCVINGAVFLIESFLQWRD